MPSRRKKGNKKMAKLKMVNSSVINREVMKQKEDLALLAETDEIFKRKRDYIVRIPKPNEPVMTCLSGGLDSVANIVILLEELKVQVYPFFIARGQTNYKWEKKAVNFYDKFFSKKYPGLYHKCLEIKLDVPGKAYKKDLIATKCLDDDILMRKRATYPARNPIIFLTGLEYGYSLQHKGIYPKTIFASTHTEDGAYHSCLTSLRCQNLVMCHITGDWSWQFTSIPLEREFGNYYSKARMLKFAHECGVPLEHTRSCTGGDELQCGLCTMACMDRRQSFQKASIEDKTKYANPFPKNGKWKLTK